MNHSTPGLPVHHQLLESTLNPCPLTRWCHPTISSSVIPFSSCFQPFPASGSFPWSQFFVSAGRSTEVSASASVLPMNIQDCFPLGWIGWISLQSKDSQEFSPTSQFKSINSTFISMLCSPELLAQCPLPFIPHLRIPLSMNSLHMAAGNLEDCKGRMVVSWQPPSPPHLHLHRMGL